MHVIWVVCSRGVGRVAGDLYAGIPQLFVQGGQGSARQDMYRCFLV
jgi:hypothetical protein